MRAFFVGLLVIFLTFVLAGLGILLFPLLIILGLFLRLIVMFLLVILAIWIVGKITLALIEYLSRKV